MKKHLVWLLGWVVFAAAVVALLWLRPAHLMERLWGGRSPLGLVLVLAALAGLDMLRPRKRTVFHVDKLPGHVQEPLDQEFEMAETLAESDEETGLRDWRRAQAHELQLLRERLDRCRERAGKSVREAKRYRRELQDAIRSSEGLEEACRVKGKLGSLYAELGEARRALFAGEIAWVRALLATGTLS